MNRVSIVCVLAIAALGTVTGCNKSQDAAPAESNRPSQTTTSAETVTAAAPAAEEAVAVKADKGAAEINPIEAKLELRSTVGHSEKSAEEPPLRTAEAKDARSGNAVMTDAAPAASKAAAKMDEAKVDVVKADAPKTDETKPDAASTDYAKADTAKSDEPAKPETASKAEKPVEVADASKPEDRAVTADKPAEAAAAEAKPADAAKPVETKSAETKSAETKSDDKPVEAKPETPKADTVKTETPKPEAAKPERAKVDAPKADAKADAPKADTAKADKPVDPNKAKDQTRVSDRSAKDARQREEQRKGQIAVFISRKDNKLYVRQNFQPLFEMPVTIAPSDRPIGTHVFTAEVDKADSNALRWSVVTVPPSARAAMRDSDEPRSSRRKGKGKAVAAPVEAKPQPLPDSPAEALDRITIPPEVMARISEYMSSGASIVVSDQGIAQGETGEYTDFIIRYY